MEESSNWVVQNLQNALTTWNDKLSEIWLLITQSPEEFKDGTIWNVITNIHGALQAIGYSLLVLFFVVGVMKTCGNFAEMKRPEILSPAGNFEKMKSAILYGADAVYLAGNVFGMRAAADNFSISGVESPISHFETVCLETFNLFANSSCDNPFCFLN